MKLTRDDYLDGLEHPFATGWALWKRALPVLITHAALPAAMTAALVTPIASHWSDPNAPAALWEIGLVCLIVAAIVVISAAVVSTTYVSSETTTASALAAQRFFPWAGTLAIVGCLTLIGYLLFIIPGIYVAIRLFWADEFALFHHQNPFDSIRSSWRLTQGAVAEVFGFQMKLGFAQLAAWLPAIIVSAFAINLLDASGLGAFARNAMGLGVATFAFTLAYGYSHACEVVYFYGLRADHELFLEEQVQEGLPVPWPLADEPLTGVAPPEPGPREPVPPDASRPHCPTCGHRYDPDDYRADAVTALCSYCRTELRLRP